MSQDNTDSYTSDTERNVTCTHCYLTYDKHDIEEGQMTRCPRCNGLVVA
jgi:uncharacterized paraquat-inducible protein A